MLNKVKYIKLKNYLLLYIRVNKDKVDTPISACVMLFFWCFNAKAYLLVPDLCIIKPSYERWASESQFFFTISLPNQPRWTDQMKYYYAQLVLDPILKLIIDILMLNYSRCFHLWKNHSYIYRHTYTCSVTCLNWIHIKGRILSSLNFFTKLLH